MAIGFGFTALEMLPANPDASGDFFAGTLGVQTFVPLDERLDLWAGVAAGYGGALLSATAYDGWSRTTLATFHGPVVAFSAGLDVWAWPWLTLGPSFTYFLTVWQEVCVTDADGDRCTAFDALSTSEQDADTLDYWMLALRATLPF